MSVNHAAHMPQSLPSFAQAFSNSSLNSITSNSNALPPIQSQSYERTRQTTNSPPRQDGSRHVSVDRIRIGRKRSREDSSLHPRTEVDSDGCVALLTVLARVLPTMPVAIAVILPRLFESRKRTNETPQVGHQRPPPWLWIPLATLVRCPARSLHPRSGG